MGKDLEFNEPDGRRESTGESMGRRASRRESIAAAMHAVGPTLSRTMSQAQYDMIHGRPNPEMQRRVSVHQFDEKDKYAQDEYTAQVHPADGGDLHRVMTTDAVFGDMEAGGPNYRNVGWMGSCVLMTKANVGIGVLSIPFVFMTVGIIPGIILIIVVQAIVTWADYNIGQFKLRHPEVYSIADAGGVILGRWGHEVFALVSCLYMIFVAASGVVSVATSLNAVSVHGTCTAVFFAVAAICGMMLASIRTLGQISWLGWVGMISIVASILTLTIAVGTQSRPAEAPAEGPWDKDFKITNNEVFWKAMNAVSSVIFSAAATPTYFGIISEMKNQHDYTKSMLISQTFVTLLYVVIGTVVYYYCGQYVSSPALGSAGPLLKRICYGLAIPALLVTLTIYSHLPAKYIFIRLLRGTPHLTSNSWQHWTTWLSCTFFCVLVAYIIASAIPTFSSIISFIGALFCPTMCIWPYCGMWLYDHWWLNVDADGRRRRLGGKKMLLFWTNWFIILLGIFLTVAGVYASAVDLSKADASTGPWSCADNSHSVPEAE